MSKSTGVALLVRVPNQLRVRVKVEAAKRETTVGGLVVTALENELASSLEANTHDDA